jgi:para-aminobenzoate synthetase component I
MKTVGCKLYRRTIATNTAVRAVTEVVSRENNPLILGGNSSEAEANRFSYWAFNPVEIFSFNTGQEKPFEKLEEILNKYKLYEDLALNLPAGMFRCGWAGYFGYELGRYIEKIPQTATDDIGMPIIRLGFYDTVICYDRIENMWHLIGLEIENESVCIEDKIGRLENLIKEAETISLPPLLSDESIDDINIGAFGCNMDRKYYHSALKKISKYIYDGDVYQINFSQRFECEYAGEAIDLYHWQNEFNPSPYAAFIGADDFAIVSASPEMFITINDEIISTKPIKGTRKRLTNHPQAEHINKINFNELVQSQKEQAELNMIIDLERNDLARICVPGSRKVVQGRTIEAYPTVFHAVATVAGKLKGPEKPSVLCDVLKATFPGGSITGAPKIRSMEIIDELEPTARGVYTGSMGFIGIDGQSCLNIAIRTIVVASGKAYTQTGGGIVADSQVNSEWEETITKATALLKGINIAKNSRQQVSG